MLFNTLLRRAWIVAGFATVAAAAWAQSTQPQTRPQAPASTQPAQTNPDDNAPVAYVLMTTSKGDIVLELNREKAPISVANFLSYVDKGFYNGTIFHRVMANFMIQGGGFSSDNRIKATDSPIKNEWQNGLKNLRGTIAMARFSWQPDSATSQFFINVKDNAMLDQARDGAAYAVFGKVVAGMDGAVEQIRTVPVGANPTNPREVSEPTQMVTIDKVVRLTPAEAQKRIDAEKQQSPTTPTPPPPGATQPAATRPAH